MGKDYSPFGEEAKARQKMLAETYKPLFEDLKKRLLGITKGEILWGSHGAELEDLMDLEVRSQAYIIDLFLNKNQRMVATTSDGTVWRHTTVHNADPVWVKIS